MWALPGAPLLFMGAEIAPWTEWNDAGELPWHLYDQPPHRGIHELVTEHSQFVIATHSPILLGYPDATIVELGDDGARTIAFDEAPQVELTRSFLEDPKRFLRHLLD